MGAKLGGASGRLHNQHYSHRHHLPGFPEALHVLGHELRLRRQVIAPQQQNERHLPYILKNQMEEQKRIVSKKTNEIEVHTKDLNAIETIKGIESDDYKVKREVLDLTKKELEDAEKEVERLSFKRSELKTVYDETAKKFEQELRNEQEREFHVEVGPRPNPENPEDIDEDGNLRPLTKEEQNAGRKAYRKLVDYLDNNVNWTAKTAPGLMVLVRNMAERS